MNNLINKSFLTFLILAAVVLFINNEPAASQNSGSVRLAYSYSGNNSVKYLSTSKILQNMDINGQMMSVDVNVILGCTVKGLGKENNDLLLEINVDTLVQTINSPAGLMGGEIKEADGKSFRMKMLSTGKETDLTEADQIKYLNYEGVSNSLQESFTDFFPDVPAEPITPGYKWQSTDTVSSKTTSNAIYMIVRSDNKFEGFEQLNGINCARISYVFSGSRDVKTQNQGMDIKIKGPITGTGELFFAADKGYFLKQVINIKMTGQVEIATPDIMSFPVTMDQSSITEVKN